MHKIFLCLRYLRKRRIAFFGIAAVMLCVALLIVVTSLFEGFIASLESHERWAWGDIVLEAQWPLRDYAELTERLGEVEGVAYAMATIVDNGLLYVGRGDIRGVGLVAHQPAKWEVDERFRAGLLRQDKIGFGLSSDAKQKARKWLSTRLRREVSEADMPIGVIVGIGLLGRPDELTDEYDRAGIVGEMVDRKSPFVIIVGKTKGDKGAAELNVEKVQRQCWVVNAVQTGFHDADTTLVYVPFDYLRDLVAGGAAQTKGFYAKVQITVSEGYRVEAVLPKIWRQWRKFAGEELGWSAAMIEETSIGSTAEYMQDMTREVRKQLGIMQILLGLVCVVASLLIFVILFMIVMQKRRDIGIVRAVGGSRSGVAVLFLGYGAAIGGAGAALGLGLGVIATHNISGLETLLTKLLGFKIWKSGVYMFSEIPNDVAWGAVGWIMIAGMGAAVVGAFLPAVRAARMQPVDTLRYE